MHTVNVDLTINYVKSNLSVSEKYPQLRCFLDARFNRDPVTVQLKKEGATYPVRVSGSICKTDSIPSSTALCFASMAWRTNEFGSPCLLDTGVSHVTFGQIAEGIMQNGAFEKDMHLIMYTAQGIDKGQIQIKITAIEGVQIKSHIGVQLRTDEAVIPMINAYINDTIGTEQQMRETFNGTENMRIPYDFSESGIQTTLDTPLPAVAFVMSETPKSNALYWDNAFNTVMKRDGLRPEEFHRLNVAGKARTAILTICYAAQYMDYVSDTVVRNNRIESYENFGDALAMNSGDCEDLAGVELQCYNAYVSQSFPKDSIHSEMQQIARNYVPPLSLDVVRGAQVSDNVVHYGAHMNDNFIPADKFHTWLEATREGRTVSKTLPVEPNRIEGLPFLVGEGTGMYEPYGYDNPLTPIMGYVYRAQSLAPFKKPILHKKGEPGSFFVGSLVGMTDYFYKRGASAPMSFWYCTKQPSGELTRGASYEDMMNGSDRVCIRAHPLLSNRIMHTVQEAVYRRVPPHPLILTELECHKKRAHHSVLERVSRAVADLKRPAGSEHQKVPIYIRPHQLNARTASQMIGDFVSLERVWKVDYELEQITDSLWGYRMEVYVN